MDKFNSTFANPFIVAIIIVIVLNIMIFFFFKPGSTKRVGRKTYFRAIFYMWLISTGILYLHHSAVDNDYKNKLAENMNLKLVNKTGGTHDELIPHLEVPKLVITPTNDLNTPVNIFNEDELI